MAFLYVTEYARPPIIQGQLFMVGAEPAITTQKLDFTSGAVQSAAFNAETTFVRVHTDTICHIEFGANPTATIVDMRLADESTEFFAVSKGAGHKLAVITGT